SSDPRCGVQLMMRYLLPLLALPVVATALSACGDLSDEDLLFKSGVPSKEVIELRPAGAADQTGDAAGSTSSQALDAVCRDDDMRCRVLDTARGFNSITFGLLDLVDGITKNPPTTRGNGVRIWGPYFDPLKHNTARFEMVRDAAGGFEFCLHAVNGRIQDSEANDITCDTDVDADTGLALFLHGTFTPGSLAGEGARTGKGSMDLHASRIPDFGGKVHDIHMEFNNTAGRIVNVDLDGVVDDNGNTLANPLRYKFARASDGSGNLHFDVVADIAKDVPGDEEIKIDAEWDASQAGRAIGSVATSTTPPLTFTQDQCWGSNGSETYLQDTTKPGDDATCTAVSQRCPDGATEDTCLFSADSVTANGAAAGG
ncbi:MAG TPA: hypothetical protein VGO62_03485, partial [Myxococcota bacterium]